MKSFDLGNGPKGGHDRSAFFLRKLVKHLRIAAKAYAVRKQGCQEGFKEVCVLGRAVCLPSCKTRMTGLVPSHLAWGAPAKIQVVGRRLEPGLLVLDKMT